MPTATKVLNEAACALPASGARSGCGALERGDVWEFPLFSLFPPVSLCHAQCSSARTLRPLPDIPAKCLAGLKAPQFSQGQPVSLPYYLVALRSLVAMEMWAVFSH